MKKKTPKPIEPVIEPIVEVEKTFTQEQVDELLYKQRQICADYATTKVDDVYIDCTIGYGKITIIDKDSITFPSPELN